MESDRIFVVPVRVRGGPGSIMPAGVEQAYVTCYARAADVEGGVRKTLAALAEDGLVTEEILQPIHTMAATDWTRHVAEQWTAQASHLPTQAEFEASVGQGRVVYGPFGTY